MYKKNNIILIGTKESRKKEIGNKFLNLWGLDYIEMESILQQIYFADSNLKMDCGKISKKISKTHYRQLERKSVQKLNKMNNKVIGIPFYSTYSLDNRALITNLGQIIFLKTNEENQFKEIKDNAVFKAIMSVEFKEDSHEEFEKITQHIKNMSDLVIEIDNKDDHQIVMEILDHIGVMNY